jgi:hypothetical protein
MLEEHRVPILLSVGHRPVWLEIGLAILLMPSMVGH